MEGMAIAGAACASHPLEPATFMCSRCGGFACARCRAISGGDRCAACIARAGAAPLAAEPVLSEGFALPFRLARPLLPFVLIQFGFALAIGLYNALVLVPESDQMQEALRHSPDPATVLHWYAKLGGPFVIVMASGLLANAFFESCCIHLFVDAIGGRTRATSRLFAEGLRSFATVLVCNLLRGLAAVVAMCFCCLPAIPAYVLLAFAETASLIDGKGPLHGLGASWRLVRRRFWLALVLEVVALLALMAPSTIFGVIARVLHLAGPTGDLAGAVLTGLVGAVAALPLFAVNVAFVIRARDADRALGIAQ